jgi:probable phosphoglycerate mutase
VYLARHGETEWNRMGRWQGHTDVVLSEIGREQANALGERLRGLGIGRVLTSDLARARETAEIVARAIGVSTPALDRDLRERAFGRFEGLTREECAVRFPDDWALYRTDPTCIPPGGEPHHEVIARMAVAVRRAAGVVDPRAPAASSVLVISHGGSIRALLSHVTGTPLPPMQNAAVFRLSVLPTGDFADVERVESLD